uniref:Immunoglobulin superfamily member 9 n=1 Tax=Sarcophilus harrisii TaxID=9305 RepID=G3WBS5_SARHA
MIWCLCLATLSLITSQGADGLVKPEAVTVVGRTGESALLSCDLLPPTGRPPLHVIEWLRFGFLLPIFIQFGLYSPRVDPHYVGRVRLQEGASLLIEKLQTEDQGWYECRVLFLDQPNPEDDFANGSWVHLTVNSPPRFLETPPPVLEVREWVPVTLHCAASGSPQPQVAWKRDGRDLGQGQGQVQVQNGTLRIERVEQSSAGIYTCHAFSPEGSATHATHLLVHDPAQVTAMPPETPLPVGMQGVIRCPTRANPPLLFVNWTKDGQALQLDKFPGWSQASDGSLVIALGNEDALGEYTCTPYNSHGTTGPSPPTRVLLKAPPAFIEQPKKEYFQEVGRELLIPCSAHGDPTPTITWAKVDRSLRGEAQVDGNSSLVLRPLSKEAHGRWECSASNTVARVSTTTNVYVLGTSPHAVINVSVLSLPEGANVSWEPGFDGGYLQRFSVWYTPLAKRPDRAHHDWISLPVPAGAAHLVVAGLQPHTSYQFSVLAQNKLGSGPFSEIILSSPDGLPTTQVVPMSHPTESQLPLSPPRGLLAVRTARGVLLHWEPPLLAPETLASYALEGRHGSHGWEVLDRAIGGADTQLLVPGLIKDSFYEFRLVAFAGSYISDPSNVANISTAGMEVYPSRTQLPGLLPQPVLAGVVGGVCFLSVAILISTMAACAMNRRRAARLRKRHRDLPLIFSPPRKSPPNSAPGSGSPDSVAKLKLQESPSLSLRQSLLWGETTQLPSPPAQLLSSPLPLEPICRGPDGRFVMGPGAGSPQVLLSQIQDEPQSTVHRQAHSFDCSSSSPSGVARPLHIADISPVGPPPSPLPAPSPLLQYLSLPFFREMNVDGDWPIEESSPAPPLDYMDTRPGPETTLSRPLGSPLGLPKAVLPGSGVSGGGSDSPCTALADWTLRERGLPGPPPAVPRGSLTSQSSGRGSASFFRPPSLAPSLGGSYLSPPSGDTNSWASGGIGLERWPRREHVLTVSKRRNTSVDENYEWDSELPGDSELLESLQLGQRGGGSRLQAEPKLGSKEPESTWGAAHPLGPEERCAALREEFLAFRRRRDATRARLPPRRDPINHPEQATLL